MKIIYGKHDLGLAEKRIGMAKKAGKGAPLAREDLLTYCGGYGGHCARYREFTAFRDAAKLLAEISDSHGFQK